MCNDGGLGAGCNSEAGCQPQLVCEGFLEIPGIIDARGCSECSSDFNCPMGTRCGVFADIETMQGYRACVVPGTVPNGEACDLNGSGDEQCASGHCAQATIMGIVALGICSVCEDDADCGGGSCVLPEITVEGNSLVLVPGACA